MPKRRYARDSQGRFSDTPSISASKPVGSRIHRQSNSSTAGPTRRRRGGNVGSRAGQISVPGKPIEQFVKENPPVQSKQRREINSYASARGWKSNSDLSNPRYRKRDVFSKGDYRAQVDYSDSGSTFSAAVQHATNGRAVGFVTGGAGKHQRALRLFDSNIPNGPK